MAVPSFILLCSSLIVAFVGGKCWKMKDFQEKKNILINHHILDKYLDRSFKSSEQLFCSPLI